MKTTDKDKIIRKQISRRLEDFRPFGKKANIVCWIRYIREGLGMSLTQLAKRLNLTPPTVSKLEKNEIDGSITLNSLHKIADAMECDLIYAFVPRKKIEDIVYDQALNKTLKTLKLAETHMELEDQKVQLDKNERIKDMVEEKIYSRYLWDE